MISHLSGTSASKHRSVTSAQKIPELSPSQIKHSLYSRSVFNPSNSSLPPTITFKSTLETESHDRSPPDRSSLDLTSAAADITDSVESSPIDSSQKLKISRSSSRLLGNSDSNLKRASSTDPMEQKSTEKTISTKYSGSLSLTPLASKSYTAQLSHLSIDDEYDIPLSDSSHDLETPRSRSSSRSLFSTTPTHRSYSKRPPSSFQLPPMSPKTNSKSAFDDEFEDPDMPFYEESPPPTDPTALLLAGQRQNEKGIRTPLSNTLRKSSGSTSLNTEDPLFQRTTQSRSSSKVPRIDLSSLSGSVTPQNVKRPLSRSSSTYSRVLGKIGSVSAQIFDSDLFESKTPTLGTNALEKTSLGNSEFDAPPRSLTTPTQNHTTSSLQDPPMVIMSTPPRDPTIELKKPTPLRTPQRKSADPSGRETEDLERQKTALTFPEGVLGVLENSLINTPPRAPIDELKKPTPLRTPKGTAAASLESIVRDLERSKNEFTFPAEVLGVLENSLINTPPRAPTDGLKKPTPLRTPKREFADLTATESENLERQTTDLTFPIGGLESWESAVIVSPPRPPTDSLKKTTPLRTPQREFRDLTAASIEDFEKQKSLAFPGEVLGNLGNQAKASTSHESEGFKKPTPKRAKKPFYPSAKEPIASEEKEFPSFPEALKWGKSAIRSTVSGLSKYIPNSSEDWTDTAKKAADSADYILSTIEATAGGAGGVGVVEGFMDLKENIQDRDPKAVGTVVKAFGDTTAYVTNIMSIAGATAPAAVIASGPIGTTVGLGILTLFEGNEARKNFQFHSECMDAIKGSGIRNFLIKNINLTEDESKSLSSTQKSELIKKKREIFAKRTSEELLKEALHLLNQRTKKRSQDQWIELAKKIELQSFENEVRSCINTSLSAMNTTAVALTPVSPVIPLVAGGITLGYMLADGKNGYVVKKVSSYCWNRSEMGRDGESILMHMPIEPDLPGTPRRLGKTRRIETDEEGTPRLDIEEGENSEDIQKMNETIFRSAARLNAVTNEYADYFVGKVPFPLEQGSPRFAVARDGLADYFVGKVPFPTNEESLSFDSR